MSAAKLLMVSALWLRISVVLRLLPLAEHLLRGATRSYGYVGVWGLMDEILAKHDVVGVLS